MHRRVFLIIFVIVFSPFHLFADQNKSSDDKTNEIQTVLNALLGTWYLDLDYIPEYLRESSQLQKTWCGYGWDENEITNRINYINEMAAEKGCPLIYSFTKKSDDKLYLKAKNNDGQIDNKIIHSCRRQNTNLIICQTIPSKIQPFIFKYYGKFLYIIIKITPYKMNCKLVSTKPSEYWLPVFRFKKE